MRGRTAIGVGRRDALVVAAVLVAAALFLFVDARTMPIVLWDESRNVVNALEMHARGLSLVTTFSWAPDLWNTKPPLLIWLMSGSVALFGASEWALRLPSMLATLATCLIVMAHVRRATGSVGAAALSAALMVLSPALFGEHGARTADYDALLLMFTTGYCCLAFAALRRGRPRLATLLAAGGAVAGAVLTKSSAGLAPGLGLALYALGNGRWRRVIGDPRYLAVALIAILPIAGFLLLREAAGPGYLQAAWHNDFADRLGRSIIGPDRPWSFYLTALADGYFATPLLLALAPLAWFAMTPRERLAVAHAAAIAIAMLVTVSAAASKLHHYLLPAIPFIAVIAAICARVLLREARRRLALGTAQRLLAGAIGVVLAVSFGFALRGAIERRYLVVADAEPAGGYGRLFAQLGRGQAAVIDPGFVLENRPGYAPVLRSYQLIAREQGLEVWRSSRPVSGRINASCDPAAAATLAALGIVVARADSCVAVHAR